MIPFLLLLLFVPLMVFADARFVEAPAECHFPYDNTNVGKEFKLSACRGTLRDYGGTVAVQVNESQTGLSAELFVIDGQDVRDRELYPSGALVISTSGADSGTNCNVVDADGIQYAAMNWKATTTIHRRAERWRVDVDYLLECWGGVAQ